jgi:hypothetical protein
MAYSRLTFSPRIESLKLGLWKNESKQIRGAQSSVLRARSSCAQHLVLSAQHCFFGRIAMLPAEYDITGKVVFITGAGRGIGKGIAQVLAGEMVVYTIAKTALVGFTRAQALEWAPYGVHVNAIAPGIFPDPVTGGEERARQTAQRAAQMVPLGRPGQLREVGLLALYLASAASDYMTGQTIFLDGGMSL